MRNFTSICSMSFATLLMCAASGCTGEDASSAASQLKAEELLRVSTPVEVTSNGFVAPPGDFNMFGIWASYETEGCGLGDHLYGILGPSDVRVEDCPDCLLPAAIDLGSPPQDFSVFATEPGPQGSEVLEQEDVVGFQVEDLLFEQPLCGEYVAPRDFTVVFEHLDTTAWEEPRTFITASATFTISEAGMITPTSDWTRCFDYAGDTEEERCTGPNGAY
jgi:hypothetical protein